MKRRILASLFAITTLFANAQLRFLEKKQPTTFQQSFQAIIGDFPYNYRHIMGGLVDKTGDFEQYASSVKLPGAETCVIGIYHSSLDTTASWQAVMFKSEEFKAAGREYRRLYHELKACKMKTTDGSAYFLAGHFEEPAEELDFITSKLVIETPDERYHEFSIELELIYELDHWVVRVNLVSKKRDNEVRPDWMEQ
jgi:hypothetical protein